MMSKMGQTIVAVQEIVDNTFSFTEAESIIRNRYGDMFVAIAEEYFLDSGYGTKYDEVHDVMGYEQLLAELEEEGVL
jgi:hypothetical protein